MDSQGVAEAGIGTIERLMERKLDDKTQETLLALFGRGGRREKVRTAQAKRYAECDHTCPCIDCGACPPYREDPLLERILYIIDHPDKEIQ